MPWVPFYAQSGNAVGEWELLNKHLRDVAGLAAEFSEVFGERERATVAGLLHDLGKYGDLFQRRLRGDERGIDHWSAGAWTCLQKYRECGIAMALAALPRVLPSRSTTTQFRGTSPGLA